MKSGRPIGSGLTWEEVNRVIDQYSEWFETDDFHPSISWSLWFRANTLWSRGQWDQAYVNYPDLARKLDQTRSKHVMKLRRLLSDYGKASANAYKFAPLVDDDYKEWRMTELKLQAIANADPKAALEEIMNKSEKPVKD